MEISLPDGLISLQT